MDDSRITLTLRSAVMAEGRSDHDLRRGERRGELTRVRRGTYAHPDAVGALTASGRHRLAIDAATRTPTSCVVSHASAAVVWGLPLHGVDLTRVHFTRPGAAGGRRSATRLDHGGVLSADDVTQMDGFAVTSPARTLVDLARSERSSATVVAADHALHHRLVLPADVRKVLTRSARLPGVGAGRAALMRVDGRSESPGESLTRLVLADLAPVDSQVTLRDTHDRFVARADLAVEDALLVVEFDGRQKYLALRSADQTVEDAVLMEKRREDAIRALGHLVMRVVWSDLSDRASLQRRFVDALRRGRELRERGMVATGSYRAAASIHLR